MNKTKWNCAPYCPLRRGWYITRTVEGDIQWRAWGHGSWWKQIKGGWIEWFDGDGQPLRYDWRPASRQNIDLDSHELPAISAEGLTP